MDRTTVARWEAGITGPQPFQRPKLATALQVSLDECNALLDKVAGDNVRRETADAWAPSPADTVTVVTNLWTADLRRRSVITSAWAAATVAEPVRRWLADPADHNVGRAGVRRVGQADVDALWTMCAAFADADHQFGGGYARDTLVHYAGTTVAPLLRSSYTDHVGRQLFAAAARLCNIA